MVDEDKYYRANRFGSYYFANIIYTVVDEPMDYLSAIEEILGDMKTRWFMKPFKEYTNLHEFSESVIRSTLLEDAIAQNDEEGSEEGLFDAFIERFKIPIALKYLNADSDSISEHLYESIEYDDAIELTTQEVFNILFNDVVFLQKFNELCASYIKEAYCGEDEATLIENNGTLKSFSPPEWVRKAVFYRDKGECRTCKKSLEKSINPKVIERYERIVPLACFGANDVTNIQLLCDQCNPETSATPLSV